MFHGSHAFQPQENAIRTDSDRQRDSQRGDLRLSGHQQRRQTHFRAGNHNALGGFFAHLAAHCRAARSIRHGGVRSGVDEPHRQQQRARSGGGVTGGSQRLDVQPIAAQAGRLRQKMLDEFRETLLPTLARELLGALQATFAH